MSTARCPLTPTRTVDRSSAEEAEAERAAGRLEDQHQALVDTDPDKGVW